MKHYDVMLMRQGRKHHVSIEEENKIAAARTAASKFPGSTVLKVSESASSLRGLFDFFIARVTGILGKGVGIDDKISTIRQISVMMDAGIPTNDILKEVAENTTNQKLKEIYYAMDNDINAGRNLSSAMEQFRDEFGDVAIAMTKLGEQTGDIAGSYARLAEILGEVRENRSKFKKAIRYPMITLLAIAAAFVILMVVVVPKFKEIFEKFDADLPMPTQILLGIESFLHQYGFIFLAAVLLGILGVIYAYQVNESFRYRVDRVLVHPNFYLVHKIIFLSEMHEYTLVFGELIKAGIPVSDALDTAVNIVGNSAMREKLLRVNVNIGRGMSLAEAFDQTGLFENILLQMIRAGERGGQLDNMMEKVSAYYAMRFGEIVDNLSAYIEPILLFFISGLVLLMALGIFLPMWDLGSVVGR